MLTEEEKAELKQIFHELWTRDVGTEGYEKKKWTKLVQLLKEEKVYV